MIRRHTASKEAKDSTDEGSLGAAKNVVYVVIIATVVIWLAPALLLGETNIDGATPVECDDSDGNGGIVEDLACARDGVKNSAMIIVDIFRYVLIVASIASVGILRVGRAAASR